MVIPWQKLRTIDSSILKQTVVDNKELTTEMSTGMSKEISIDKRCTSKHYWTLKFKVCFWNHGKKEKDIYTRNKVTNEHYSNDKYF